MYVLLQENLIVEAYIQDQKSQKPLDETQNALEKSQKDSEERLREIILNRTKENRGAKSTGSGASRNSSTQYPEGIQSTESLGITSRPTSEVVMLARSLETTCGNELPISEHNVQGGLDRQESPGRIVEGNSIPVGDNGNDGRNYEPLVSRSQPEPCNQTRSLGHLEDTHIPGRFNRDTPQPRTEYPTPGNQHEDLGTSNITMTMSNSEEQGRRSPNHREGFFKRKYIRVKGGLKRFKRYLDHSKQYWKIFSKKATGNRGSSRSD